MSKNVVKLGPYFQPFWKCGGVRPADVFSNGKSSPQKKNHQPSNAPGCRNVFVASLLPRSIWAVFFGVKTSSKMRNLQWNLGIGIEGYPIFMSFLCQFSWGKSGKLAIWGIGAQFYTFASQPGIVPKSASTIPVFGSNRRSPKSFSFPRGPCFSVKAPFKKCTFHVQKTVSSHCWLPVLSAA
jgi:hypothetical protein